MTYKERRMLEKQWIKKYGIDDSSEAIALKALELLKPALINNPWSRQTEMILDVLTEKLEDLETNEQVISRNDVYIKHYDALIKYSKKDYMDYMVRNFDAWASQIKEGIEERNNEYITNGQFYVGAMELTIFTTLYLKAN